MKRAARLNAILDLLAASGEVTVEELVERFEASPATTRRDLDTLAAQRLHQPSHPHPRPLPPCGRGASEDGLRPPFSRGASPWWN